MSAILESDRQTTLAISNSFKAHIYSDAMLYVNILATMTAVLLLALGLDSAYGHDDSYTCADYYKAINTVHILNSLIEYYEDNYDFEKSELGDELLAYFIGLSSLHISDHGVTLEMAQTQCDLDFSDIPFLYVGDVIPSRESGDTREDRYAHYEEPQPEESDSFEVSVKKFTVRTGDAYGAHVSITNTSDESLWIKIYAIQDNTDYKSEYFIWRIDNLIDTNDIPPNITREGFVYIEGIDPDSTYELVFEDIFCYDNCEQRIKFNP